MLKVIDTSNYQGSYSVATLQGIDAIICKASECTWFVDSYCDHTVQQCRKLGIPWGFYHFADERDTAYNNAEYFVNNCLNYFGEGIPVLDWEELKDKDGNVISNPSVDWVNKFVNHVHERTGVWCWIYANPWRFNQGGVEPNCARWVADYPSVVSPTFYDAESWACPEADGNVVAWQFCSDGHVEGYDGNLDCSIFYGNADQWRKYANPDALSGNDGGSNAGNSSSMPSSTLENDEYRITIERKQ